MLRRNKRSLMAVGIIAVILLAAAILEGDIADDLTHVGSVVIGLLNRFGAAACLILLYLEESGVPLPVPGDFYIAFMGKLLAASLPNLVVAWIGIIVVVVAGSSNLYWISRRWGPALLRKPLVARLVHLDEARLHRTRRWFDRWGALAIIFGRHLPGFRIVLTVVAATMGVPYRVFAPSVAVSTAIWAAVGLWLGATVGQSLGHILSGNAWLYLVAIVAAIVLLAIILVREWRAWGARRAMSG
jgi:membrane-associated protein